MHYITAACAATIAIIAAILILDSKYEDGLLGRAALSVMAFGGGMTSMVAIISDEPIIMPLLPSTIVWGMALFITRHYYRYTRWRFFGIGCWTRPTGGNKWN